VSVSDSGESASLSSVTTQAVSGSDSSESSSGSGEPSNSSSSIQVIAVTLADTIKVAKQRAALVIRKSLPKDQQWLAKDGLIDIGEEQEEEDQYLEQKALGNKPQKGVKCVNFRPNRGGDRFSLFNVSFSLACWFVVRNGT